MTRKYKHHTLSRKFIGIEGAYSHASGRFIEELPEIDYQTQKTRIKQEFATFKRITQAKENNLVIPEDKGSGELSIKFYGQPKKQMLDKYRIEIYEYKRDEKAIVGKISTKRLQGQERSDLERLEHDINLYTLTGEQRSYFNTIEDIKPLSPEEIIEDDLQKFYQENPTEKRVIDISFSNSNQIKLDKKINSLIEKYGDTFISKVNTSLVHFCRIELSYNEIMDIVSTFNEVKNISTAPIYYFENSNASQINEEISVTGPNPSNNPIIIIDSECNTNHKTIKDAVIESNNTGLTGDRFHATAVASLTVCGGELSPSGNIIQKNTIITVEADFNKIEETVLDVVTRYSSQYPLLLINCSINQYGNMLYNGTKVSNFTVLLDELSSSHNCLFFISAGNSFSHGWDQSMKDLALSMGYPHYFSLPFTHILPPADSINNISVGSLVYQSSPRSMAPSEHPSPITRRNFDNNTFIKPDLLHYDTNLIVNSSNRIEPEGNGLYLADQIEDKLTKNCGTSFATPLVAHEAGILHSMYPEYNNNSIKAILLHFANDIYASGIVDRDLKAKLTGFGKTDISRACYSLGSSSTIVIEDTLGVNNTKKIKIPIPASIQGSARKRLKIRKTLVYNPKPFPQDSDNYNPIKISAGVLRDDAREMESFTTNSRLSPAHKKSNVKRYPPIELSTNNDHCGKFWEIEIRSECKIEEYKLPLDFQQKYSLVLTIEDMNQDPNIDIHQELSQMLEIELPLEIEVS